MIGEFGAYHGFARGDLAFVDVADFLKLANNSSSDAAIAALGDVSERNKKQYDLGQGDKLVITDQGKLEFTAGASAPAPAPAPSK